MRACEAAVLIKDGGHGPVVHCSQAADEAAGAVFALVAVYQDRMVPVIQEALEGRVDHLVAGIAQGIRVSVSTSTGGFRV